MFNGTRIKRITADLISENPQHLRAILYQMKNKLPDPRPLSRRNKHLVLLSYIKCFVERIEIG